MLKGIPASGPISANHAWMKPSGPAVFSAHPAMAGDRVLFSGGKAPDVEIMRLVLSGPPKPQAAAAILRDALAQWPAETRARFLITPGAFIEAPWPEQAGLERGWETSESVLDVLSAHAEKVANRVLTPEIRKDARGKVDYITLGVDLTTDRKMHGPHAELVGVYDVRRERFVGWTGKSYPLAVQENTLAHVTDLGSHLLRLDGERVMVLGCHDLNMFSPRAYANQAEGSHRRQRTEAMRAAAEAFAPTLVLQHPHGTDTPNIWRMAWTALEKQFPSVKGWASAIGFYNFLDPGGTTRSDLDRTLKLTRSDAQNVGELVVDTGQYR